MSNLGMMKVVPCTRRLQRQRQLLCINLKVQKCRRRLQSKQKEEAIQAEEEQLKKEKKDVWEMLKDNEVV